MNPVVVTDPPRPDAAAVDALARFGVATVHEAQGRSGYLGPDIRPRLAGCRISGVAVTALCWPGDNLMIHVAVEQCRAGDILVVALTSPCTDGLFGELLATSLHSRGVRGVVIDAGVRDTAELAAMGFPTWSRAVSAQGSVKATPDSVNVDVVIGGQLICPGDAILADDDGVVRVERDELASVLAASEAREAKEAASREAYAAGELGLDRYGLREPIAAAGLRYVTSAEYRHSRGGSA